MFRTVFFLFFLFSINSFSQSNISILDEFILEGKEMWKIPGISVVVVKNDSTLYKKTFGKKNIMCFSLKNEGFIIKKY